MESLKEKTIKGIKWTTFSSIILASLQIIQLIILARLLSPSDFGLMAMVMVAIGFSNMFIDMGLSNVIIFTQNISINALSSLYWMNLFIGFFVLLIVYFLAPYIASFYNEPSLVNLLFVVSFSFVIQPFGQQFMVLLQKELAFDKIALIQIICKVISFVFIVYFAYIGLGVFSLAYGLIINVCISSILYFYFGRAYYMPKFYFKYRDIKEFFNFGLFQLGEKMLNYFGTQFDTLLIGKVLGVEVLGVYDVAKNLVSKPSVIINPVITKVTFPVMSKIKDELKLKEVYLKTINLLTFVNTPVFLLIFLYSEPLILFVIGEKWLASIPIIKILSLGYLVNSIGNPAGSLLLSRGKVKIAFYWNLATFILYPILVSIGSLYGVIGIAFSFLFQHIILIYPNWRFIVNKVFTVSFWNYNRSYLPFFGFGIVSVIFPYFITYKNEIYFDIVCFLGAYFFFVYFFKKETLLEISSFFNFKRP